MLGLAAATATQRQPSGPAHNLPRSKRPMAYAMAPGSDRSSRRLMATVRLSVGRATGSHVAGAGHQRHVPPPQTHANASIPRLLMAMALTACVFSRAEHMLNCRPRAPERHSETLVVHYFLKTRRERCV